MTQSANQKAQTIDLDTLKHLSAVASQVALGQEEVERNCSIQAELALAHQIIEGMKLRLDFEARAGRNRYIVMTLGPSDFETCETEIRGRADLVECRSAAFVFDECVALGLQPTIDFWFRRNLSGFHLIVHW